RNRLSPTRLCEIHEEIHRTRPAGDAAHAALRRLRGFGFLLAIMPRGNIYIRHHLTLSALYCEVGEPDNFHRHARLALVAMRRLCYVGREPWPYLEGWSYCLYVQAAYR